MIDKKYTNQFSQDLFACNNIIRSNDKLSIEEAFDEMCKILYMKRHYEQNIGKGKVFLKKQLQKKENDKKNKGSENHHFELVKKKYIETGIFLEEEKLKIQTKSLESIILKLEKYNFLTMPKYVLGKAFDLFLSRVFRRELGRHFSPRPLVDFIVNVLDPEEGETIIDPCCGTGGFLIKTTEYVRTSLEQKLTEDLVNKKMKIFASQCIYGTDVNERMCRITKMNMILHNDKYGHIYQNEALNNIEGIFDNQFDIVVTDSPFGIIHKEGKKQAPFEKLLLERFLSLLKPGGRMGIVLPDSVLKENTFQEIRDFIETRAKIILITSIPDEVFKAYGTNIKTSVLFIKKFNKEEGTKWETIFQQETKKMKTYELGDLPKEVKARIKKRFNYPILIAEVKYAGVSATGAKIQNDLIPLAKEFTEYRKKHQLWPSKMNYFDQDKPETGKYYQLPEDQTSIAAEPDMLND